ncbi:unnamed protein product, partial [Amoebophrya sp. A120]
VCELLRGEVTTLDRLEVNHNAKRTGSHPAPSTTQCWAKVREMEAVPLGCAFSEKTELARNLGVSSPFLRLGEETTDQGRKTSRTGNSSAGLFRKICRRNSHSGTNAIHGTTRGEKSSAVGTLTKSTLQNIESRSTRQQETTYALNVAKIEGVKSSIGTIPRSAALGSWYGDNGRASSSDRSSLNQVAFLQEDPHVRNLSHGQYLAFMRKLRTTNPISLLALSKRIGPPPTGNKNHAEDHDLTLLEDSRHNKRNNERDSSSSSSSSARTSNANLLREQVLQLSERENALYTTEGSAEAAIDADVNTCVSLEGLANPSYTMTLPKPVQVKGMSMNFGDQTPPEKMLFFVDDIPCPTKLDEYKLKSRNMQCLFGKTGENTLGRIPPSNPLARTWT